MGTASLTQHLANHTQHHHIVLVTVSSGTSVSLILQKWNLRPREVLWLSEDTELEGGVPIYLATTGCSRCLLLFQAAANAPNYQDVNTFHSGSNTGHAKWSVRSGETLSRSHRCPLVSEVQRQRQFPEIKGLSGVASVSGLINRIISGWAAFKFPSQEPSS